MADEKPNKYEPVANAPIPSYEEAIGSSSRTSTPTDRLLSSTEASHPAEREGLLGSDLPGRTPVPTRRQGYRPPPTEESTSPRDSLENDAFLGQEDGRASEENEVRREMEEMEVMDPPAPQSAWGKRISSISNTLSRFNLPRLKNLRFPSFDTSFLIILARIFAIFLVVAIVYLLFVSDIFTNAANRMAGQMFDPEAVRVHVQTMVDERRIRWRLEQITKTDHLAGTEGDYVLAEYVQGIFATSGLEDVHMDEFGVYLNYPKEGGRKIEILGKDGKVTWSAKIEEDQVYTDPPRQQTPVFHGHSKAGDVTGPLLYANYGSRKDFKRFYDSGIDTKGAIALVRYHGTQGDRALKVKAAEEVGFAGCIIYSDPADTEHLKKDEVQRGSVSLMSWVVGDVLTPGWASTKGAERIPKENNPGLVNIPSIPISWGDAQHLLRAIQGYGETAPDDWTGAVPNVVYWSGNASSPKVHLVNEQDEVNEQKIWNVMGKIQGIEQSEKSIIIGNHRDAWAFGASDPGSGTAIMLEVVHIFGDLVSRGWRPLRTIEFASWDAEEYNLIGSTEYVEQNIEKLRTDGYVYLNIDTAVGGQDFHAAGSPIFRKALLRVLDRTVDPGKNATLRKLFDERGGQLDGLGAGSDYVAFQDIAGTSSIDFGFSGKSPSEPHPMEGSTYAYHSVYDNFDRMITMGDPGFQYHKVVAQVLALLILEFCDRLVLPFDMGAYSASLTKWVMDLEQWAENKGANQDGHEPWNTSPLREAVIQLATDSRLFEKWEVEWDSVVLSSGGFESPVLAAHRKSHNNRMANFETHLLDLEEGGGIPNRTQFKHVIFGPQLWSGYDEAFFPAIRDAVEAGDWSLAKIQVEKAANIIKKASRKLVGNT
ncbi:glutamate carboxypeptidase-like protein 1 [Phlyctema vagabunda]|uniref:Glutamate carboxypeptidase-like protein 1 n=1 Tax=Phlyctema vagabunda TaxID=108571 RepID=A0ABR4PYB3_9HELO